MVQEVIRFYLNKRNLALTLLSAILVFCGLVFLDPMVSSILSDEQTEKYYQIFRKLTDAGESTHFFVISLSCILYGALGRTGKGQDLLRISVQKSVYVLRWGQSFLLSLLGAGAFTHLIKFLVGRQRPHLTETHESLIFEPLNINWHFQSFPSGHTQTLFTAAVAFSMAFPRHRRLIFFLAALLSSTRIFLRQHFFSDVVFGAYIGFVVATLIFSWRGNSKDPSLRDSSSKDLF